MFSAIWNMTPFLFHYKISILVSAKLDRFHFTGTYTITFTWDSMLRSLQIASKGWISEKKISDDVGIFMNSSKHTWIIRYSNVKFWKFEYNVQYFSRPYSRYLPDFIKLKILKKVCGIVRSPQNSSPCKSMIFY